MHSTYRLCHISACRFWCATLLSCSIMHSISSVTNILLSRVGSIWILSLMKSIDSIETGKIAAPPLSHFSSIKVQSETYKLYSIQSLTSLIWFTSIKVFFIRFCQFLMAFVFPLKTFRSQSIIILSWYYIPHQMWCDLLSILLFSNDRHWWFFRESVTDMYEILA